MKTTVVNWGLGGGRVTFPCSLTGMASLHVGKKKRRIRRERETESESLRSPVE